MAINCSDVATGRQMVGFILVWDFAKKYCGWENMVDENWSRSTEGFLQGSDNNDLPLNPHGIRWQTENGEENRWQKSME